MLPAKACRPVVVAACLGLAVVAYHLLHWARPAATRPAPDLPAACTTLPGLGGWVMALAFSPDSNLLAIGVGEGVADGHWQLYDVANGRWRPYRAGPAGAVTTLAFSPTADCLAIGTGDGAVLLHDLAAGRDRLLRPPTYPRARQLAFAPDGKTLAVSSYTDAAAWNQESGAARPLAGRFPVTFATDGKPRAAATTGGLILAATADGTAFVREADGERATLLFSTGDPPRPRPTVSGDGHAFNAAAFSPDGRTVATASNDRTVKLWDAATGDLRATLAGHARAVYSVAFSPDGKLLASGGFDGTVKLWRLDEIPR